MTWWLENFLEAFGRTAQPRSLAGAHHRPLDQDRMRVHGGEQRRVGRLAVVEAELVMGRAAPAQEIARLARHLGKGGFDLGDARRVVCGQPSLWKAIERSGDFESGDVH